MPYQDQQEKTTAVSRGETLVGKVIAGKYLVLSQLGRGGMSSVYKAEQQLLRKVFALKMLHPHLLVDNNAVVRFRQEASAAINLSHPNIITIFDFDIWEDRPFQVIDYLDGVSLSEEIKRKGGLPLERLLPIWKQIARGLEHAHNKNVVHRDLKPSNVMLTQPAGQPDFVKILDFGIAKVLPTEGQAIEQLTQTGEIFGSPSYMSPEQCLGNKLDTRSDIYSMGCLMYESVVGKPPFSGESVMGTIRKHLEEPVPEIGPYIVDPNAAQQMEYILARAMAKDPDQRYQSMKELVADLESLEKRKRAPWLTTLRRRWQTAQLRSGQKRHRMPGKVVAAIVCSCLLIASLAIFALVQPLLASVPAYQPIDCPTFTPEFTAGSEFMAQHPEIQIVEDALTSNASRIGNKRRKAQRLRDAAAADARCGNFGEVVRKCRAITQIVADLQKEDNSATEQQIYESLDGAELNRGKLLADFASIGDGCYFAEPPALDYALKFYSLAETQLRDNAKGIDRRLKMKMADLKVRQGEWASALKLLKMARGLELREAFPATMFKVDFGENEGINDRAVFKTLIGMSAEKLGQFGLAQHAWQSAGAEWRRLSHDADSDVAGQYADSAIQSYFHQALCCEADGSPQDAERILQTDVLPAFTAATPKYRTNMPAVLMELSQVQQKQGKWWDALYTSWQAHYRASMSEKREKSQ